MSRYYCERLSAERLRDCYDLAPPTVLQYLEAEIGHVLRRVTSGARVLELGCGYGRVLQRLVDRTGSVAGIDTSPSSLRMARSTVKAHARLFLALMDAAKLGFSSGAFDVTVCIQNGISAFGVNQLVLFQEAVRVTRPGGRVLFSSYARRFWKERLAWFEAQAERGLIGPIDRDKTGHGVIVCRDGFRAATVDEGRFRALAASVSLSPVITEVDGSSLFCEVTAP